MRKILALLGVGLLVMCLVSIQAQAGVTLGPGGSITTIREGEETKDLGNLFAEAEYSANLDGNGDHWLGLMAAYDADKFSGMGVRYYRKLAGGAVYPGAGTSIYHLGEDILETSKNVLGVDVFLEVSADVAGVVVPIKAFASWHGATGWLFRDEEEVSMFRYGVLIPLELPQE